MNNTKLSFENSEAIGIEGFVEATLEMDKGQLIAVVNDEHTDSRLKICIALARLQDQLGSSEDFQKFLDADTCLVQGELDENGGSACKSEYRPILLLPKSTASEYATMGKTYIHHRDELAQAGFDPTVDMKKLLVIAQLHKDQNTQEEEAIASIRSMSYLALKQKYAKRKAPRGEKSYTALIDDSELFYKGTCVLSIDRSLQAMFCETLGFYNWQGFVNKLRKATDELFKEKGAEHLLEGITEGNPIVDSPESAA
jgi:hypothetical protein